MLELQKLFKQCESLDQFRAELTAIGVDQREYPEQQMMLLDYNQIEAVKNHPITNTCRGIILGYDGTVIRKSFDRFFNLGENGVSEFDFENSIAFEKADGSMCPIYFCPATNRWEIGTRGTAFAEGPNDWHGTFRAAMLIAMGRTEEQFQEDCKHFDKNVTRVYEYISPDNRIVTPYVESMLVALVHVNNVTGEEVVAPEVDLEKSLGWNVRKINQYRFNTQEDCMVALNALTDLQEGYVVYNTVTKERIKLKNLVYLAAHRIRGQNGVTLNSVCELVVMGEEDEYLAYFETDRHKFVPAQEMLVKMIAELEAEYDRVRHIVTQKDFALAIKDFELSCVLFKARKNITSVFHEFNQFPVSRRAEWVKERLLAEKAAELATIGIGYPTEEVK